jgi:hypothetical protein
MDMNRSSGSLSLPMPIAVAIAALSLLVLPGCARPSPTTAEAGDRDGSAAAYVPGLGEIMTLQQMRHSKLWFAGEAKNWELATYEVEELVEGFDDVIEFHPTHKEAPVAPRDAVPRMITQPLAEVRAAAELEDPVAFTLAYDRVTEACNRCHAATDFAFNVVARPTSNPFTNQVFELPGK